LCVKGNEKFIQDTDTESEQRKSPFLRKQERWENKVGISPKEVYWHGTIKYNMYHTSQHIRSTNELGRKIIMVIRKINLAMVTMIRNNSDNVYKDTIQATMSIKQ
jgi:hypothetical protein